MAAQEPFHIDYAPIKEAFDELPVAIVNRLMREKATALDAIDPALRPTVTLTVKVADVTWRSIRFLCADIPQNDRRKPEFAISVPPLARTILDSLFTTVLLFDRPKENIRWYIASGWREVSEEHHHLVQRHGTDPDFTSWLAEYAKWAAELERDAAIRASEKAKPKLIPWWPNPGKMVSAKAGPKWADASRVDFLRELNIWFYSNLSGDSHLSYTGLVRRGGHFAEVPEGMADTKRDVLTLYRSQVVLRTLTLLTSLLSEIVGQFGLRYEADRLRVIWKYVEQWPEAKELYDLRYSQWLPS